MRRRLSMALLVVLFVGGAVLWEYRLSTPVRTVFLALDESARSPRWARMAWTIEREGREVAHGAVFAREGRLPGHELLGNLPLKRGPHVLRAGFVAATAAGDAPLVERRVAFDVGDDDVVLLSIEGDLP